MLASPSFAPAYSRIYQDIVTKISTGVWKPGDQLPTERDLALKHGVSIGTVRKAMDTLERAGFCIKAQGKGTFVAEYKEDRPVFFKMSKVLGGQPVPIQTIKVLVEQVSLEEKAALFLQQPAGGKGIRVFRTLYHRGPDGLTPVGVSESLFPLPLCEGLLHTPQADFLKHSLYHILDRDCHAPMLHSEELISICTEPPRSFCTLFCTQPPCCFDMSMVTQTYGNEPLEYRRSYIDGSSMGLMRNHDIRQYTP